MVATVPVIEKQLYLKLISRAKGTASDVSLFRSPADKFIIYRSALTGKRRVSFYDTLSIQSPSLPHPSLTSLPHTQASFAVPVFLLLFFYVLRNNLSSCNPSAKTLITPVHSAKSSYWLTCIQFLKKKPKVFEVCGNNRDRWGDRIDVDQERQRAAQRWEDS